MCRSEWLSGDATGLRAQEPPCPWDEYVCSKAAMNGHLEMLQWLRAQDLPEEWQVHLN